MKRFYRLPAMLALVGLAAVPGSLAAQGLSAGVKAGVNITTVGGDDVDVDANSLTRFVGGAFLTFPLSPMLAIQPEILLAEKGAGFAGGDAEAQMDYLEVPLLLKLSFGSPGTIRPNVFAGPTISFDVGCKLADAEEEDVEIDCDDVNDDVGFRKSTLFGLALGAGVDIPLGTAAAIVIDGRYGLDLTSWAEDDDFGDPVDIKHRAWSIMAGFSLPLGGGMR